MALLEQECKPGMPVIHVNGFTGILTNEFDHFYENTMISIIRSDTGKRYKAYLYNLSRYSR